MTIPKAVKQANTAYRCTHFGKWGENMISTFLPTFHDLAGGHSCQSIRGTLLATSFGGQGPFGD